MTDTPTRADLIERLRSVDVSWSEVGEWCAEAAAALTADAERIAALEGEVERLREALRRIDTVKTCIASQRVNVTPSPSQP